MRLFNRKKDKIKDEVSTITTNPTISELNTFFNTEDITNIGDNKLTSSTYYTCMLIRCNTIAKLPLKLKREDKEKGSVDATDNNLYNLLGRRPNPFMTPHDFIWATEFQRLEYGNAFWVYRTDIKGKITGLYLLNSPQVEIYLDEGCILDGKNSVFYVYTDTKKGQMIYTSENIVHFKNFAKNGVIGTSIKKYMCDTITNEQYATNVIKSRYTSGLQDPIVVTYIGDLNDAKQQKIRKKFDDLGGAKNAGKVIPIPTDFDIKQLETKLVNNQFFQLQGLNTRQIANAFGVKGFQLNDMEKSTYNNIEQQNKAYYVDTLQNVLTNYEQEMNYKLLTEEQPNYYFSFNVDSMLRSDTKTRYECHNLAISQGWKSRAEIRKTENLPYIEGTEELSVDNGACIPLKNLGEQYVKGGDDDGKENISVQEE